VGSEEVTVEYSIKNKMIADSLFWNIEADYSLMYPKPHWRFRIQGACWRN